MYIFNALNVRLLVIKNFFNGEKLGHFYQQKPNNSKKTKENNTIWNSSSPINLICLF